MGFNPSCVGPQTVMSSSSHQFHVCPPSSTCTLGSPISVSCLYFGFPIPTVFSPCFGLPFCTSQGQPSTSCLPLCIPMVSGLFLWGSLPLQWFLFTVQAPVSRCCFSIWPLLLVASQSHAPGAFSVAGKDAVLCLSCHAGCSGAGGAVLCWREGHSSSRLAGAAKSKSTCTGRGSGTAQGCSPLHRLK